MQAASADRAGIAEDVIGPHEFTQPGFQDPLGVHRVGEDEAGAGEEGAGCLREGFETGVKREQGGAVVVENPVGMGQAHDIRSAHQVQVGPGKCLAQSIDGGKGEDEIAAGPAANHGDVFPTGWHG